MKVRLFWLPGLPPVPVISTRLLRAGLVGLCMGPFVLVHPSHADDWPTIVHELEHCRQFWHNGLLVHFLRYHFSSRYRLRTEVHAYRRELQACPPAHRAHHHRQCARALAHGYRLQVSEDECHALLAIAADTLSPAHPPFTSR